MVTIADVAEQAGVSPSTVSYVLTKRRPVSAATTASVEETIRRLGYRPHAAARSLRADRTRAIALFFSRKTGGHAGISGDFLISIAAAARSHDYDVLLMTADDQLADIRRVAGSRMVDAAVLLDVGMQDQRLDELARLGLPAAALGYPQDSHGLPFADFDFGRAAGLAVQALAQRGHRRILFVGFLAEEYYNQRSYAVRGLRGARRAAKRHGVDVQLLRPDPSLPQLRSQLAAAFAPPAPTGIMVHSYSENIPILLAYLRATDRHIPRDVSVIVINAPRLVDRDPPLNSILLPIEQMATNAVDLAIAAASDPIPHRHILLAPELTDRGSVAPPPTSDP